MEIRESYGKPSVVTDSEDSEKVEASVVAVAAGLEEVGQEAAISDEISKCEHADTLKRKRDEADAEGTHSNSDDSDSEEEEVWEEIPVVFGQPSEAPSSEQSEGVAVSLPFNTVPTSANAPTRVRITLPMRLQRAALHQTHLLLLVAAAKQKNKVTSEASPLFQLPNKIPRKVDQILKKWLQFKAEQSHLQDILKRVSNNDSSDSLENPNTCALLMTALFRRCNVNCRLIASLHPTPLSFAQTALSERYRHSHKDPPIETDAIRLWLQIHDPKSNKYISISPDSATIQPATYFAPALTAPDQQQLVYVIAFQPDGTFRDVSELFNTSWAGRVAKLRPKSHKREEVAAGEWWDRVCWLGSGEKSVADKAEDRDILSGKEKELMPARFDGFKGNAIYALERHLTQSEVIHPLGPDHAIGTFKTHLVYPRSSVHQVLSAVNWRKRGRQVRDGEPAVKRVKARHGNNIAKKREIELERLNAAAAGDEDGDGDGGAVGVSEWTDLFGEWQTEDVVPDALLEGGKIPKNRFGNFELLHPNMMPEWGTHILAPGAAQLARKLGIEYVPVMTGFEHHRGRATPTMQGIMVLKESKEFLLEACAEDSRHAQVKADAQKSKRVLGNWRKLVEKAVLMQDLRERHT
ncbi:hypothetical protein HDU98_007710 [Podochytrium sp. JEL0797]|nr:hypothetical protein HDU98_007710 [Podochytrium sp. JEL0797]